MLRMVDRKRYRDSALLGLMLGLALAPKVAVLPLMAPLVLVYWYRVLDEVDGRWSDITPELVQRILGNAAVAAAVAVAVFFVSAPYVFLDVGAFVADLAAQTRMAGNAGAHRSLRSHCHRSDFAKSDPDLFFTYDLITRLSIGDREKITVLVLLSLSQSH